MSQYKGVIFWSLVVSLQWFGHLKILYIVNLSAYFFLLESVDFFLNLRYYFTLCDTLSTYLYFVVCFLVWTENIMNILIDLLFILAGHLVHFQLGMLRIPLSLL